MAHYARLHGPGGSADGPVRQGGLATGYQLGSRGLKAVADREVARKASGYLPSQPAA